MSEHKFSVGDKVRVKDYDRIVTIIEIDATPGKKYIYHTDFEDCWWSEEQIEPVSDHITEDEIAKLIASTSTERDDAAKLNRTDEYEKGFRDCAKFIKDVRKTAYKQGWMECTAKMLEYLKEAQND